jgi:hypothetical protein
MKSVIAQLQADNPFPAWSALWAFTGESLIARDSSLVWRFLFRLTAALTCLGISRAAFRLRL